MILAGILFKLGAYGLLRFGVFLLPQAAADLGPLLLTLAAIGITYGALVTIMQKDLKRLVAYASIVDVGLHRARHLRLQLPGRHRRRASRWSTTG